MKILFTTSSIRIKFEKTATMDTIVIEPANDAELLLLKEFLEKSHIKSRFISEEDKEYMVLGLLMQETDYTDTIDTANFIKGLQQK